MAEGGGGDEVACQPLPEPGGYDYTYVEEPPENLNCPICIMPCREPQIIDCCGAKFCRSCIERERFAGRPCPLCRVKEFKTLIDREHQRKILGLKVYCNHREQGCQWVGEVRHIDNHLAEDCQYVLEVCRWKCGRKYKRKDIKVHEEDECGNRPMDLVLLKKVEGLERRCEAQHNDIIRQRESLEEKDRIIKELKEKMEEDRKEMETKMANVTEELKTTMADNIKKLETKTETKMADNTKELEKKIGANQEKIEEGDKRGAQNNQKMEEKINEIKQTMKHNDEGARAEIAAAKEEGKEESENIHKMVEEGKQEVEIKIAKVKEEIGEATVLLQLRIEELKQDNKKLKDGLKQLDNNKIKPLEEQRARIDKEFKDMSGAVKVAVESSTRVQDGLKKTDARFQREAIDRINTIERQFGKLSLVVVCCSKSGKNPCTKYMVSGQISSKIKRREFSIFIIFSDTYTCTYVV